MKLYQQLNLKIAFCSAFILLSAFCLFTGCTQSGDPVSPDEAKEFEERAMYLYSEGVYPEFWWAEGANARGIGEDLDCPLDLQLPETEYYHIDLFQSINELKQATEQAVTKEYAEKYLYPWGEKTKMFVEHDGKLYANAYFDGGIVPFEPESITFLRKEGNIVFLTALLADPAGEISDEKEIQLELEDGIWKLRHTYITEFFEKMLSEE